MLPLVLSRSVFFAGITVFFILSVFCPTTVVAQSTATVNCTQHSDCAVDEYCQRSGISTSNRCSTCSDSCYDSITSSCPRKCNCDPSLPAISECGVNAYCFKPDYYDNHRCGSCSRCHSTSCPSACLCTSQSDCAAQPGTYCGRHGVQGTANTCRRCDEGCINEWVLNGAATTATSDACSICPASLLDCRTHSDCGPNSYCSLSHKCLPCGSDGNCFVTTRLSTAAELANPPYYFLRGFHSIDGTCPVKCCGWTTPSFSTDTGGFTSGGRRFWAFCPNATRPRNMRLYHGPNSSFPDSVSTAESSGTACQMTVSSYSSTGSPPDVDARIVEAHCPTVSSMFSTSCEKYDRWVAVTADASVSSTSRVYFEAPRSFTIDTRGGLCALGTVLLVIVLVMLCIAVGVCVLVGACVGICLCVRSRNNSNIQQQQQQMQTHYGQQPQGGVVQGTVVVEAQPSNNNDNSGGDNNMSSV